MTSFTMPGVDARPSWRASSPFSTATSRLMSPTELPVKSRVSQPADSVREPNRVIFAIQPPVRTIGRATAGRESRALEQYCPLGLCLRAHRVAACRGGDRYGVVKGKRVYIS